MRSQAENILINLGFLIGHLIARLAKAKGFFASFAQAITDSCIRASEPKIRAEQIE